MTWYLCNSSGLMTNRILNRLGPQTSNCNFPIIFPTGDQHLTSLSFSKQINILMYICRHLIWCARWDTLNATSLCWLCVFGSRAEAALPCAPVGVLPFGLPNGKRVESDADWQVAAILLLPERLLCSAGPSEAVGSKCRYNHLITLFSSVIKPLLPYMLG